MPGLPTRRPLNDLAVRCMVRAGLLALQAGAPAGLPLTIRRRAIWVHKPAQPGHSLAPTGHAVARHVVEWGDDDARGVAICDVVVPLGGLA